MSAGLKGHGSDQGTFKPGGLIKKVRNVTVTMIDEPDVA